MTRYFRLLHPVEGRAFAELKLVHLRRFPIPPIDFGDPRQREAHDELARLAAGAEEAARTGAARRYHACLVEIDALVPALYGLRGGHGAMS